MKNIKKLAIPGIIIAVLILPWLNACQNDGRTSIHRGDLPSNTVTEAPDDIVHTPGGDAYRANVNGSGPGELIPDIQTVNVTLKDLNINYRSNIETKAGETRNNILFIWKEDGIFNNELVLYSVTVPEGIRLSDVGGAGRPGILLTVLAIAISEDVTPGQYTFQIGIEINGEDYGTIPCTVSVIE